MGCGRHFYFSRRGHYYEMTITIFILDAIRATVSALPVVTDVIAEGFDTDGNYTVTGSVSHIIPREFLYRVEKQ